MVHDMILFHPIVYTDLLKPGFPSVPTGHTFQPAELRGYIMNVGVDGIPKRGLIDPKEEDKEGDGPPAHARLELLQQEIESSGLQETNGEDCCRIGPHEKQAEVLVPVFVVVIVLGQTHVILGMFVVGPMVIGKEGSRLGCMHKEPVNKPLGKGKDTVKKRHEKYSPLHGLK